MDDILLNPIKKEASSVANLLINQIRHDILFAVLPLNFILSADFLKTQYGGSTIHLNEALEQLQLEGFVQLNSQQHYQVIKPIAQHADSKVKERTALECKGLEHSMLNGNIHWLAMVLQAQKNWCECYQSNRQEPELFASDFEQHIRLFHQKIISACGSIELIRQQDKLFQQGHLLRIAALQSPQTDHKTYANYMNTLVDLIIDKDIINAKIVLAKLIDYI